MHSVSATQSGSSAGGRLKYASPQDLPSYPSIGLSKSDSAASAAASLGWASQKPSTSEPTGKSSASASASASAAALLACDTGMSSSPSLSSEPSASLKAATLAAGQPSRRERPTRFKSLSNNAAAQAFRTERPSPKPSPTGPQASDLGRRGSILAASGAMSKTSARPRAQSSPLNAGSYADQQNAASNALNAATLAHRPSIKSPPPPDNAGAVPYTTMSRNMFTAAPPVKPEVDEENKNDRIHSDAVAMARKIYTQQQAMFDAAKKSHDGDKPIPSSSGSTHLQDTAYRLAQQRLSKMDTENQKARDYQEYYGASSPTQRRFGSRAVLRRRASSDSDVVMRDRRQSEQIRRQMSIFNKKLSEVDEQKRTQDRQALLALAHKNVQARLAGMDSKITAETGWAPPSTKSEWQAKAQSAARLRSDERTGASHQGQVDIGGGKYMDMKEVEAIASKRTKPELERIYEKADRERERLEKIKAEQEAKRKEAEEKKAKEKEEKEAQKKQKEQERQEEKARREKEKQEERERKDKERQEREKEKQEERERREQQREEERRRKEQEKAAKLEQKKQAKEEKRRAKELATAAKALKRQQEAQHVGSDSESDDASSLMSSGLSTPTSSHDRQVGAGPAESPRSPQGKVKTWLKTHLTRPRGRSNGSAASRDDGNLSDSRPSTRESGFVGGAANDSMRDVALAGRDHDFLREGESEIPMTLPSERPVSPLSSSSEEELPSRSRTASNISGPTPSPSSKPLGTKALAGNLPRDSRFQEMME